TLIELRDPTRRAVRFRGARGNGLLSIGACKIPGAMTHDWWLLAAVPLVGFVSGFVNTLAGIGSLITLPLLIVLGLPANVANGTNRVGILVQCIVSVATFRRRDALPRADVLTILAPSVLGAAVGAELAADLDEALL